MSAAVAAAARQHWRHGALWVVLCGAFLLQIPLRQVADRAQSSSGESALYVTSGKRLRQFSLGFEGLLADLYWTRAVQYYGRERMSPQPRYEALGPLLRITTELDPHLLAAYRFGAIFLAEKPPRGAGQPGQAMQLLRRGIVANPDYWRLWEDLGFVEYWDLKNYPAAARIFQTGSEQPGAEGWMKALAAAVAAKGGELRTSWVLWSELYRSTKNTAIRKSAAEHLAAIRAEQEIGLLDRLLAGYQQREGRTADSFSDLISAGVLHSAPLDPAGIPFVIGADHKAHLSSASPVKLRLVQ